MSTDAEPTPAKAFWLYLLQGGGFHRAAEVKARLPGVFFANVNTTANDLLQAGSIVSRMECGRRVYGVTRKCRLPKGLTVDDVLQAVDNSQEARA